MSVKGNHFRCSMDSENEYFQEWAHFMDEDIGMCAPVAHPLAATAVSAVAADAILPGDALLVAGSLFESSSELTCRIVFSDGSTYTMQAFYYSAAEVRCVLPFEAVAGDATVTVSNYGEDYATTETIEDFATVQFTVTMATEAPAMSSNKKSKEVVSTAAIGGIAVAALIALVTLCGCGYLVLRERAGKPMFMPLAASENALHGDHPLETQSDEDVNFTTIELPTKF